MTKHQEEHDLAIEEAHKAVGHKFDNNGCIKNWKGALFWFSLGKEHNMIIYGKCRCKKMKDKVNIEKTV